MDHPRRHTGLIRKIVAIAIALLAVPFFTGFLIDGPQSTIDTAGPVAAAQKHLFYITLGVTCFIFVTVGSVLAYAQIRFRARKSDDGEEFTPPQTHGHPVVEVGLIIASTLLLVIIAVPTVKGIYYQEEVPAEMAEDAFVVKATGYQWWFKFEYPELGIVTANEMVIPTNRPIHIELRTMDVIHSFWVPRLAGKKDMIPNRANSMWLLAEKSDYFWAQCAEFCGESHANMRFRVISLDEPEFTAWVKRQQADARTIDEKLAAAEADRPFIQFAAYRPDQDTGIAGAESPFAYWQFKQAEPAPGSEDPERIARGRQLFRDKTCVGCHTVRGHQAAGIAGPDLTHFGSRTTIAAGLLDNTPENLRRWLRDPNAVKPGNLMWRDGYKLNHIELTEADLDALVAYLHSLK